jgi:ATP/maltotriose-dependent transcriptional regulator MalT
MLLEEALGLAREAGSQTSIAHNLCLLGNIACHQNINPGRAKILFQESLSLFREERDTWGITDSLLGLASVTRMQRDYELARRFYNEILATMTSEMGYNYSVAEAIWGLGAVARAEGDYEQAQTLYQKALILNKGLDTWDTAYCLAGLGGLSMVRKEPQRAASLLGAAAVLFESHRDLYAADRIIFDRDLAAARAHLNEAAYRAAWAAGQAMTLEQAIAYALENSTTTMEAALSEPVDDSDMAQHRQAANQPLIDPLSSRELEVLRLLAAGFTNPAIAQKLVISVGTVKAHTSRMYRKLGVDNRVQAVNEANKLGLL